MVAHQHSRDDEASSRSVADLELQDVQFAPDGRAPEPRMMALAVSNQALLDSLRPVAPPSIRGWLAKQANPWWRHVEYGYTEAAYWLWARAPWQRWALSGGLGALLGVAIVVVAVPQLRPDLERVVAASSGAIVASTQVSAAAVVIAPLRQEPPAATQAVKVVEPALAAEVPALSELDAPTAVEVSEQVVEDPAAPDEGKSKKNGRHGKRRAKPKSASSLSQLFMNIHRPPHAKSAH
jgi:hypothetical protein